jgi:hypothetical protein
MIVKCCTVERKDRCITAQILITKIPMSQYPVAKTHHGFSTVPENDTIDICVFVMEFEDGETHLHIRSCKDTITAGQIADEIMGQHRGIFVDRNLVEGELLCDAKEVLIKFRIPNGWSAVLQQYYSTEMSREIAKWSRYPSNRISPIIDYGIDHYLLSRCHL